MALSDSVGSAIGTGSSIRHLLKVAMATSHTRLAALLVDGTPYHWMVGASRSSLRLRVPSLTRLAELVPDEVRVFMGDAGAYRRATGDRDAAGGQLVRFFAGLPLHDPDGERLATLLIADNAPRYPEAFLAEHMQGLELLADYLLYLLRSMRQAGVLDSALKAKSDHAFVKVCSWCNKVQDEFGNWRPMAEYLRDVMGVDASHGMCETCSQSMMDGIEP